MNFALEGLKRLRERHYEFTKSTAIEAVKEDYKELINPFYSFSLEHLEQGSPDDKLFNSRTAEVFQAWCELNGDPRLANISNQKLITMVMAELSNRGIQYTKGRSGKQGRYLSGVKLVAENSFTGTLKL